MHTDDKFSLYLLSFRCNNCIFIYIFNYKYHMPMATKKFILSEKEIPQAWYNIVADMPHKPMSPLNPATKQPLAVEDL